LILLIAVLVLLLILAIVLGQNADEPAAAIIIGVIAGTFVTVPVGLGIGVYRQERTQRQPPQYVTHQHLHVYQLDAQGQPTQISETTRTLTTTR
jgi:preprotein translocase subunit SecF